MVTLYEAEAVSRVKLLHHDLLKEDPEQLTVRQVVERQALALHSAHGAGDPVACVQLSNWLPRAIGRPNAEILAEELTAEEAFLCVAREHGFTDGDSVTDDPLDPDFEAAANAVVTGDLERLSTHLEALPELAQQRSAFGHRATLLHYVAANGVETWRQTVPSNAVEITSLLLAAGSDPGATMPVYDGGYDTLALLLTSAHPAEAGIAEEVAQLLRDQDDPAP